jgi:uncharacterized protein (TIGR02646 family)
MRTIAQAPAPHSFLKWMRAQRDAAQNLQYSNLPTDIKNDIKQTLLKGQGHLCAYTQRKLLAHSDCHIEHVVPQNQVPELGLSYNNMLACFPADGGDTTHGHGAPIKSGLHVQLGVNFVSPYAPACDQRFLFDRQGLIHSAANDGAAQHTIKGLRLNHPQLVELRQQALSAHGLTLRTNHLRSHQRPKLKKSVKPLTAKEAQTLAGSVMQTDAHGHLEPFCNAISQVATAYAEREMARAARIKKNH